MEKKFTVSGMTCSACSARVERCVNKVNGVSRATVNLISGVLSVEMAEDVSSEIRAAVIAEGYGVKDGAALKRSGEQAVKLRNRLIISLPLVVLLMYVSMSHMLHMNNGVDLLPGFLHDPVVFSVVQFALCLPVLIINGHYFRSGFVKLFTGSPNMDSLIALGSAISFIYSVFATVMIIVGVDVEVYLGNLFYEGAAMILAFITIGKFLEEKSKNKTMSAVEKLLELAPDTAVVKRDGDETEIKSSDLIVGDTVVLKEGFTVPADGTIKSGSGWTDESVITGESVPVYKEVGSKVVCGTRFVGGYAEFAAESVGEDSTVFKIVRLVEDANSTKVPIAKVADKVAGIFVPTVIVIAVFALIGWLIGTRDVALAIRTAVSVLVVSCPCALGLATPAALMAGTGKAAENGILVKSGEALQNLASIDVAVLDKTGTVTYGKPEVDLYRHVDYLDDKYFIGMCASLERQSSHVLGKPVIDLADKLGCPEFATSGFSAIAGSGITGSADGKEVLIGNSRLMADMNVDIDVLGSVPEGLTVLFVAFDRVAVGYISIKDKIKPSSKVAADEFGKLGVDVVMLTGDSESAASSVAAELGVKYRAEVLPQDKHSEVRALAAGGAKVMMVGDGVNDAPALTEASVGVAIGAGTDIAIESADVVLIRNDLTDAAEAVRLGRAVMRNIKENLFWAFFYNVILIPIACGALMPFGVRFDPMLGSFAMSMSSLFVVGNALRLRFFSFRTKKVKGGDKMFGAKQKAKAVIRIDGMMCDHCKARVEKTLTDLGLTVEVDLKKKCAYVYGGDTTDEAITTAITAAGYTVTEVKR